MQFQRLVRAHTAYGRILLKRHKKMAVLPAAPEDSIAPTVKISNSGGPLIRTGNSGDPNAYS